MKLFIFSVLWGLSCIVVAKGDPTAGQTKAQICSACHGNTGQSTNPLWPNLAGQYAPYLLQQLQHYQKNSGPRPSPIMVPLVAMLRPQDMEDLAEFYAHLPPAPSTPSTTPTPRGEQLYRLGDISLQIPACITCHGPDGRGAEQAGFPMISHQQPSYIVQQLEAFKTGTRSTDPLQIMRTICAKLTPQDMQELAQYIAGL